MKSSSEIWKVSSTFSHNRYQRDSLMLCLNYIESRRGKVRKFLNWKISIVFTSSSTNPSLWLFHYFNLFPFAGWGSRHGRCEKPKVFYYSPKNPPQDYHGSLTREFVWQFKELLKVFVGGVWSKDIVEVNISNSSWWFYGLQHLFH